MSNTENIIEYWDERQLTNNILNIVHQTNKNILK